MNFSRQITEGDVVVGVEKAHVVMTRGSQRVDLIGMTHVAAAAFFDRVIQFIEESPQAVVLAEGTYLDHTLVTRTEQKVLELFTIYPSEFYRVVARNAGLVYQFDAMPPRPHWLRGDLSREAIARLQTQWGYPLPSLWRLKLQIWLARRLPRNAETVRRQRQVLLQHGVGSSDTQVTQLNRLVDSTLARRTDAVWRQLETALAQYDHIIVPYGSAHLPELQDHLQRITFRSQEPVWHTAFRLDDPIER